MHITSSDYVVWHTSLVKPTGVQCVVVDIWLKLRLKYLGVVQFVRLLKEVLVACWVIAKVVAKNPSARLEEEGCGGVSYPMIIITCWVVVVCGCI